MSQRGSAPRPASHRSPKTSPRPSFSSPRLSQPSPQAGGPSHDDARAPMHDSGGASGVATAEAGGGPPSNVRTSDVHGVLNTSESFQQYPAGPGTFQRLPEAERSRPSMGAAAPQQHGASPFDTYVFQAQQAPAASLPGYPPVTERVPGLPAPRGSPTTGSSLPPFGGPRRILTPKSPRVASLSRAARRNEELQHNPLHQQPAGPEFRDVSPRSRPETLGTPATTALPPSQAVGLPLPPLARSPVAARSLSQPIVGQPLPPTLAPDYTHGASRPSLPGVGLARFQPQQPLAREAPSAGPSGETRWSTGNYRTLAGLPWSGGLLPGGESQHLLTITPQYGEEIVVPVDTHQGSKTQDQKRQKNAIASARFRTRKKEREHQLEADNNELSFRVRELEGKLEFYRNERNRLRDIVSQTPSISQWANGPPSPVWSREQSNFQGEGGTTVQGGPGQSSPAARRRRGPQPRSPSRAGVPFATPSSSNITGHPRPPGPPFPQPPPYSYSHAEPAVAEPPARRRRLDEPQFTTPTYGPPPPTTTLPPMAPSMGQPAYALKPAHHPPTPPGIPRLPPLRIDHPSPGSEHLPQPQTQTGPASGGPSPQTGQQQQQQQQYNPTYGRSYESAGWVQKPPGQHDGGQR